MVKDRPGGIRITNEDLRSRMGLQCISDVLRRGRLRWFGHVARMQEDNCVNRVSGINVDSRAIRDQPRKTWDDIIKSDLRVLCLDREAAKHGVT